VDIVRTRQHTRALWIMPANCGSLRSVGSMQYSSRTSHKDANPVFNMYDLAANKETELGSIAGYEISANQQKMLINQAGSYSIIDLPKGGPIGGKDALNLSGLQLDLDRRAEWRQIYHESWRQMRDFFYVPNLHGVDWNKMR